MLKTPRLDFVPLLGIALCFMEPNGHLNGGDRGEKSEHVSREC